MTTTEAPIQTQEIITISPFQKTKEDLIAFIADYENLVVTEETLEEAKKARAAIRDVRYGIQDTEKENIDKCNEVKSLTWSRAGELYAILTPTEEKVDSGIKAIEKRKAEARAEKERLEREKVESEIRVENERLAQIERDRIAKIEAEQKAERERLAALQAEIEAKNQLEQDRLKKIQEAQEEKERAIQAEQLRIQKEQEQREAEIRKQQQEIENQKREMELAKEREANEKKRLEELEKARIEASENARIQAEQKAKREAEEKIESDKRIAEELARQEALKPDKQKLYDYLILLESTPLPVLNDDKTKSILGKAVIKVKELSHFVHTEIEKL
jgi:colicin import membrane protein